VIRKSKWLTKCKNFGVDKIKPLPVYDKGNIKNCAGVI